MEFLQDNFRHVLALCGVLIWLSVMAGPWLVARTKATVVDWLHIVQAKTNLLNVAPLCFVLAVYFWPAGNSAVDPVTPQRIPDIVDTCTASGRALLADELDTFAAKKFDSDKAREDAINEAILDVIEASYVPLNEEIARAIKTNRVTDCADKLRKGELRSE